MQNGTRSAISKVPRARLLLFTAAISSIALAQDLAPRAYVITPVHTNAVTLTYSHSRGNLLLDGSVPITGATAKVSTPVLSFFHTLNMLGRSANIAVSLPYGIGNFQGKVVGAETNAYRSGLLDASVRFSVNLKGGPAMDVQDFRNWQQKTILGASFKLVAPTGQYDPTRLVNYGSNRWAFKPEIGLSQRWGHWVLDAYGAVWFFTANHDFFSRNQFSPETNTQKQDSTFAFEGHLSYDVRPRLWASVDGNFWVGGRTTLNGVENPNTLQRNSRLGGTFSVPLNRHQSLKFSYSRGAYIRYGGNYDTIAMAWQYSWLGRPK